MKMLKKVLVAAAVAVVMGGGYIRTDLNDKQVY